MSVRFLLLVWGLALSLSGCGNGSVAIPAVPIARSIYGSGVVEGKSSQASLRFEISGRITLIAITEGQHVSAGQVLAEIDSAVILQESLKRAALLDLATARLDRGVALLGRAALSREEYDAMFAAMLVCRAEHESAAAMLNKCSLRTPCGATVLATHGEVGEMTGPHSPRAIVTVADTSEFRVRAFIEEMDAMNVHLGQRSYVTADGLPGERFYGVVVSLAPSMQPKQITRDLPGERRDIQVRECMIVLDPQGSLIVGLRVDVFLLSAESTGHG